MIYARFVAFVVGIAVFSYGVALTVRMQRLGLHPWDVLNVGLYERLGLSIGSWNVIVGLVLIGIAFILDKSYIKIGTFLNAILVGTFVDIYLVTDILPAVSHTWTDFLFMILGVTIMGIGGGWYNALGLGAGPRDGFMLSISDKTGLSIGLVRIISETTVLFIGFLIGGPVFIFTFIITFIQSPIFQFSYKRFLILYEKIDRFFAGNQEQETVVRNIR